MKKLTIIILFLIAGLSSCSNTERTVTQQRQSLYALRVALAGVRIAQENLNAQAREYRETK